MVNQFAMSGISPEEKSINPAKSLMFDAKSALFMPATDALLAEVRAQGVEAFVMDFTEPAVMNNGTFYNEDLVEASNEFAAQLSQEAAQ